MPSQKKRSHRVVLHLTFDQPCSATHATAMAKDCIHGDFYPTSLNEKDPGLMKVKTVTRMPTVRG
jgi:hypothetical protein